MGERYEGMITPDIVALRRAFLLALEVADLTELEREAVRLYFLGLAGDATHPLGKYELGDHLGIPAGKARRTVKAALAKMRDTGLLPEGSLSDSLPDE